MATAMSRGDCFKSFLAERKAEYRSKFPFLTESQVVAKLKRVWNNQRARDTRAAAEKSSSTTTDTKSECSNNECSTAGDSNSQAVLMSSKGLPGETLRRKVKPPPLSRSLTRFVHFTPHHPPSPTNKENTTLTANNTPAMTASSMGGTGAGSSSPLDCYTFTEEEQLTTHKTSHSEGASSLIRQKLTQSVSLPINTDQKITELKSFKKGSYQPSKLKEATQLPNSDSAASPSTHMAAGKNSKQANKKPQSAAPQQLRMTRSSLRNAVAAATNYQTRTTTATTMESSTTSGIIIAACAAAAAGNVDADDIRDKKHSLSTHRDTDMKGIPPPLSDCTHTFDSDPRLDCYNHSPSSAREHHQEMGNSTEGTGGQQQQQGGGAVLQSATADTLVGDVECCTMTCVYHESQIMGPALRSSAPTQGNVESGGCLTGLSEHSHVHNINTTITDSTAESSLFVINGGGSGALGNPKTDSIPTKTSASAYSRSLLQFREPATCVHSESTEVTTLHVDAGVEGTGSMVGGWKQRGRGGKKRGRKRRGRGRGGWGKKDPNESWIRTNSQPQICDRVEDLLEFSQNEQISCSLPEKPLVVEPHPDTTQEPISDMIWEESSLPNIEPLPEGREKDSSWRRAGVGTRASFRGRGRRGRGKGQQGRGTMATTTTTMMSSQFSGRVTRSKSAALLKSKQEDTKGEKKVAFSSAPEREELLPLPPPAKKLKPEHEHPSARADIEATCSKGNLNGATIMDISAPAANTVCSVNDGVALSDPGVANSVCSVPRGGPTADALFSTANANDSSKHSPTLIIRPREGSVLFDTPSLKATVHISTCSAALSSSVAGTGSIDTASASAAKSCKSSSPSPRFAQCSSSTSTTQPRAQQPSMQLTPIQVDPLCDMFLPLTPERKRNDIFKDIGSFYNEAPTERRTFHPATGSKDQGYCLFADDADIFL